MDHAYRLTHNSKPNQKKDKMKTSEQRDQYRQIARIAKRYQDFLTDNNTGEVDHTTLMMDLEAVADELDLDKLEKFDTLNFNHDVSGIRHNINRETGELENCFLPRCSK